MQRKIGCFLYLMAFLAGCEGGRSSQSEAMLEEPMKCFGSSQVEISAWSKNGWSKSCKMRHGQFSAWREGTKVFDGYFEYGVKEGVWKYYDESGLTIKHIEFRSGKEIKIIEMGNNDNEK